jgi:syntaxin 1B/2/3
MQLMSSNRYGESRAAYREVQERHEDIKRIEKTLGELAQLFNDVSCRHSFFRAANLSHTR